MAGKAGDSVIAVDPSALQNLRNQRALAIGIACVMTFVAVVAVAGHYIEPQQREARERAAQTITARPVAAINP